ncbi:MAG: flagellar biosynthesis protein FliQ [Halobacteriovoraceae bacterium]|nr:flagellar biosynthesis protein FliQ [Halobacteriovoraceae bacterium]
MDTGFIQDIAAQAVKVSLLVASPMLFGALFMGIAVSIFQAVTQINEQTLSFIPKMLVIIGVIVALSPWMTDMLVTFTREMILMIPDMVIGK